MVISQKKVGAVQVRTRTDPRGPVHSPPGPGPTKMGLVHPLTGPDTRTYGVGPVRTRVHEGQDRTLDSLHKCQNVEKRADQVVGYNMGNPWVRFLTTAPEPVKTIPVPGLNPNLTCLRRVLKVTMSK